MTTETLKGRKVPWPIVLAMLVLTVVGGIALLRSIDASRVKTPDPTRTPQPTIAGISTTTFDQVNDALQLTGAPTNTKGPDATQIIGTQVQATLVTQTPIPTFTRIPTNTPVPSNTPLPTSVGVGTAIFHEVQRLQVANGDVSATPGLPLDQFIHEAAVATVTAIAKQH